jgi:hypothetical protein
MANSMVDVEVHGEVRPELEASLAGHVNLVTGGGTAPALLIDGERGGYDEAGAREALEAGRVLVLLRPTEAQLGDVASLTGATAPDTAMAVSVSRDGSGGYRLAVVPEARVVDSRTVSEDGEPQAEVAAQRSVVSPGSVVARLAGGGPAAPAEPAPGKLLGLGDGPSLLGPEGSYSGYSEIHMPFQAGIACVGNDFKRYVGSCQYLDSRATSTFFVYWVDGATPPHYVVVLRQRLHFGAGNLVANDIHIRGYGMYVAKSELRDMRASSGQVHFIGASPETGRNVAAVREEMRLTRDLPGGKGIANAVVEEGTQLTLPDWTVFNRSSPARGMAAWEFVQANTLAGLSGRALTDNLFDGQVVRDYPAISKSTLTATTYASWHVTGGPRVTLYFGLELLQNFMILAVGGLRSVDCRGGWLGTVATGLQPFSLDLAAIAKPPL